MPGYLLQTDPTSEDAANVPLTLNDGTSGVLLAIAFPPPPLDPMRVGSADTEGELLVENKYKNREIPGKLRAYGSSDTNLATWLGQLEQKIAKINREGGTLAATFPSGLTCIFDLVAAEAPVETAKALIARTKTDVEFKFEARPFWRMTPTTYADNVETTKPCLVFTVADVPGDVPALGKLVVDNDSGADQWFLQWGLQSRFYDSAATAKLFYEAEELTPLGGAATSTALDSTASGSSSPKTVLAGDLTTNWQAILSTQLAGGGAHLSHIGTYRVFARVQTPTSNTGAVQLALEWGEGDFRRFTRNDSVDLYPDSENLGAWEGTMRHVDLGMATLSKVAQGAQRWEGRVLAKSTVAGDDIHVDCLYLFPVDEGYGEVRAVTRTTAPTALSTADSFAQSAGALNGKTADQGGAWTTEGTAPDFQVTGSGRVTRAVTPALADRRARIGSTAVTNVMARVDVGQSLAGGATGLMLRRVDANNYMVAYVLRSAPYAQISVWTIVGGSGSQIAAVDLSFDLVAAAEPNYTIAAYVDAGGRVALWFVKLGMPLTSPDLQAHSSVLATGGTLASGTSGLYDFGLNDTETHYFDNFDSWVPAVDAAVFASQSLELRHDRVIREDSSGAIWTPPSKYEGDYLRIPASGREDRTTRIIVKGCRNDPDSGADSAIDDISARLTITPRGLTTPE